MQLCSATVCASVRWGGIVHLDVVGEAVVMKSMILEGVDEFQTTFSDTFSRAIYTSSALEVKT